MPPIGKLTLDQQWFPYFASCPPPQLARSKISKRQAATAKQCSDCQTLPNRISGSTLFFNMPRHCSICWCTNNPNTHQEQPFSQSAHQLSEVSPFKAATARANVKKISIKHYSKGAGPLPILITWKHTSSQVATQRF